MQQHRPNRLLLHSQSLYTLLLRQQSTPLPQPYFTLTRGGKPKQFTSRKTFTFSAPYGQYSNLRIGSGLFSMLVAANLADPRYMKRNIWHNFELRRDGQSMGNMKEVRQRMWDEGESERVHNLRAHLFKKQ